MNEETSSVDQDALLQRRRRLLVELDRVQKVLSTHPHDPVLAKSPGHGTRLAFMESVRRILVAAAKPCKRDEVVWELIQQQVPSNFPQDSAAIESALDQSVELGLVVERGRLISLPEWTRRSGPTTLVKDSRVQIVLARMHVELCKRLSITELAKGVGLSPSRLSHLFRRELTMAPAEYLRLIRMKVAANMLRATRLKQKEIVRVTGLADRSHFSRQFKQKYGTTPSQFRDRNKARVR
jgi:AraC-like DNA-binding protein